MAEIFFIRIHICKKYFSPLLLFLRWKPKERSVLGFGLHLPLDLINLFQILYYYSMNLFNLPYNFSNI